MRYLVPGAITDVRAIAPDFTPCDKLVYLIFSSRVDFEAAFASYAQGAPVTARLRVKSSDFADFDTSVCEPGLRAMIADCSARAGNFVALLACPSPDQTAFELLGATHFGSR